jgi:hypothetical protein
VSGTSGAGKAPKPQKLVADATATGADAVDPDALANQVQLYRSAAQIVLTQTSATPEVDGTEPVTHRVAQS